jgi:hypothetical protein
MVASTESLTYHIAKIPVGLEDLTAVSAEDEVFKKV